MRHVQRLLRRVKSKISTPHDSQRSDLALISAVNAKRPEHVDVEYHERGESSEGPKDCNYTKTRLGRGLLRFSFEVVRLNLIGAFFSPLLHFPQT